MNKKRDSWWKHHNCPRLNKPLDLQRKSKLYILWDESCLELGDNTITKTIVINYYRMIVRILPHMIITFF